MGKICLFYPFFCLFSRWFIYISMDSCIFVLHHTFFGTGVGWWWCLRLFQLPCLGIPGCQTLNFASLGAAQFCIPINLSEPCFGKKFAPFRSCFQGVWGSWGLFSCGLMLPLAEARPSWPTSAWAMFCPVEPGTASHSGSLPACGTFPACWRPKETSADLWIISFKPCLL